MDVYGEQSGFRLVINQVHDYMEFWLNTLVVSHGFSIENDLELLIEIDGVGGTTATSCCQHPVADLGDSLAMSCSLLVTCVMISRH